MFKSYASTVTLAPGEVSVEDLEELSSKLAEVIGSHGVFGAADDDYAAFEKQAFVNQICSHVKNKDSNSLELTYRNSCVRLIIKTQVVDGVAKCRSIAAFDHPVQSARMDYAQLNADIQEVLFS